MDDHFTGIREFIVTVESGSLSAAALILDVTGSAIGKSISKLEARLGVQLLHRTTRRLTLTSEGEAYFRSCKIILEEIEQTEAFLSTGSQKPIGRIRVDLPTTFGRRHIMPTLIALSAKHDGLDLSVSFQDRAVDMISEGVDIAVRIGVLGDYPDLIAKRIGEQKLVICASRGYLSKHGTPTKREDLKQHDCLVGRRRDNRPAWQLRNEKGEVETYEVPVRHELFDGDALMCSCLYGSGLAQLPNWLANEAINRGDLVQVMPEFANIVMPIHVVWQKTRYTQPKVKVAVEEIVKFASENPEIFFAS